jgi:uncharacterized membrane protein
MPILIDNLYWMGWNIFLSFLPVIFGYLGIKYSKKKYSLLFFILWFIFFANSIYLVTDIQYLPTQFSINPLFDFLLIVEYFVLVLLGVVTYFYSLLPIIKFIEKGRKKLTFEIFLFNFVIAFGVILGKVERTESWDLILNPSKVIGDIIRTINSPALILSVILFGVVINLIYFAGRDFFRDLLYHL